MSDTPPVTDLSRSDNRHDATLHALSETVFTAANAVIPGLRVGNTALPDGTCFQISGGRPSTRHDPPNSAKGLIS